MTSLIQDCIEYSCSDILSGDADICSSMSSANEWFVKECDLITVEKDLIYMEKRIGPRNEP